MKARLRLAGPRFLVLLRDIHEGKLRELEHEHLLVNLLAIFDAGSQALIWFYGKVGSLQ